MMLGRDVLPARDPHIPVLLQPLLAAVAPVRGLWLDGTLGAGGYTRGLLEAGAECVIGIDRDPLALQMADWAVPYGDRVRLVQGTFSDLDTLAGEALDGVVLDLGVSSMQLDQAERGFSFMKDGPLDMRMSQSGDSAADLVNTLDETTLADILYNFGEERASRRIARAIADLALARSEGSPQRFYSMSAQIRAERSAYYDQLEQTQKGGVDVTDWLIWFLACLQRAIHGAQDVLSAVLDKARFWERAGTLALNARQNKVLNRLLDGFEGKMTSSKWATIAKCSQDTANRDIALLINAGLLRKGDGGGRSTHYEIVRV